MKWNEIEEKAIPQGFRVAPRGRYPMRIVSAEAGTTSSDNAYEQVALRLTIEGHSEELDGVSAFENLITDPRSKAPVYTKGKLRQLGIDVDSEIDLTNEQIAEQLLGQLVWVDLDIEGVKTLEGGKLVTKMVFGDDGREVPAKRNTCKAFYTTDVGGAAPQQRASQQPDQPGQPPQPAPQPQPPAPAEPAPQPGPPAPNVARGGQPAFANFPGNGQPPQGPAPWQTTPPTTVKRTTRKAS